MRAQMISVFFLILRKIIRVTLGSNFRSNQILLNLWICDYFSNSIKLSCMILMTFRLNRTIVFLRDKHLFVKIPYVSSSFSKSSFPLSIIFTEYSKITTQSQKRKYILVNRAILLKIYSVYPLTVQLFNNIKYSCGLFEIIGRTRCRVLSFIQADVFNGSFIH